MLIGKTTSYRKALLSFVIAVLTLFMTVTASFAWFYNQSDAEISFTAGEDSNIECYYSTYDETKDEYTWKPYSDLSFSSEVWDKKFTAESVLHMGTVDNLSVRTPNNVVWYSFKVQTSGNESFTGLRLSLSDSLPFRLYTDVDTKPVEITDKKVLDNIKLHIEKLIKFDSLIVSAEDYTKFFTSTNITVPLPNEDTASKRTVACVTPLDTTIQTKDLEFNGEFTGQEEYYYIYFRVYPELKEYAKVAEFIGIYMPCVIQFNIQLDINFGVKQAA